ncbi:MAG: pilus assembly protein [Candidatus Saccharibacteria bacterium]|nr:pilus assembly protein [Moraxellaceae bacterium]
MISQYYTSTQSELYAKNQRGSTLIAVLLILLVITVLGVMAMRQGLTTLGISTSAQVRQLLVQSSDTVLNTYSNLDMNASGALSLATVVGSALSPDNLGRELVFCYRPTKAEVFNATIKANTIHAGTGDASVVDDSGGGGFCNLTTDFGSGRNAVVTQVAVLQPTTESTGRPGDALARDTSVSENSGLPKGLTTQQPLRIISTSMLPSMATGSLSDVQTNCLEGRISDNTDEANANKETITDCLARYGVPANTQVQEYNLSSGLTQTTAVN